MAWIYEQKFNSLTDGDLNGQDSWTADVRFDVVTTGNAFADPTAIKDVEITVDGTARYATRSVTAVTSGTVYFSMRTDGTSALGNLGEFQLYDASGRDMMRIIFRAGDIQMLHSDGGTWLSILSPVVANTWYRIGCEFDAATDDYRCNIDDGAFSAWKTAYRVFDSVTVVEMGSRSNVDDQPLIHFDYISPDYVEISTDIKTINGLAIASVKTVNGLVIASVKSVMGLT